MMPWSLWVAVAGAHALAPAGLDLTLVDTHHAGVVWRTPMREAAGTNLAPVWPDGCTLAAGAPAEDEEGALVLRGSLTCAAPIVGLELVVDGLAGAMVDVVVTVRAPTGHVRRVLLHDPVARWTIAEPDQAPEWFPAARILLATALRRGRDAVTLVAVLLSVEAAVLARRSHRRVFLVAAHAAGGAALTWWWCA